MPPMIDPSADRVETRGAKSPPPPDTPAPGGADGSGGGRLGLVICAKTGRTSETPRSRRSREPHELGPDLLGRIWRPRFPSADLVGAAAAMLPRADRWLGDEGPRWYITVAPGAVRVSTIDRARWERTAEREQEATRKLVDYLARYLDREGEFPADPKPSREIIGWSRKSRANMVRTLCELDYEPFFTDPSRPLAMLTLTYPGDWETVAPDGKAVKRHLAAFRRRYERAWGEPLIAVWKLEFQRRGAPHFHILMRPPQGQAAIPGARARSDARVGAGLDFRRWLSEVWADIVGHPDPEERRRHRLAGTGIDWNEGLRATDPRRVAVYFTKHGSFAAKEYQHCVPEAWREPGRGPGRFWGYWHLERATRGAEVSPADGIAAGRILRRWARAQGVTRELSVPRVDQRTGTVRYRTVRRPAVRLPGNRGWVSVNDGAAFGATLARWLAATEPESAADRRARWALLHAPPGTSRG